ncbi:MAG: nucleoside monophosphate kinase [Candidatus Saccharibacteria bacterium]|nr:nucleoside monophosphate kinase [Candidatus Saccharibacteria bacterium]
MEEKLIKIRDWLGTGSINIFGLPMSGKDTQGVRLAEALGAKFLSSGLIIRAMEAETRKNLSGSGELIPTDTFFEWVLPYFSRTDLKGYPLVLSSIGRWYGEENAVMNAAADGDHPIKAVVILNISEADVMNRFEESKILNDRGMRRDDANENIFEKRLLEFRQKTLPVLKHYRDLGMLVEVNGDQSRDEVFAELVEKLSQKAS